jgi:NAD-dependent deacetylase
LNIDEAPIFEPMKKKITILSGAGMSAESGIRTFRDSDGLWEEHRVEDVATPTAWQRNPGLVLEFYNQRRKQLLESKPNAGHLALALLEEKFDVKIVTQNVDNLHECAGSSSVLHLHGELVLARTTGRSKAIYPIDGWQLNWGEVCPEGFQLRPHIVWFGEEVVEMPNAISVVKNSDAVIIVGTSMQVYPANGLIGYAPRNAKIWVIDPNATALHSQKNAMVIAEKAGIALPRLVQSLLNGEISV